MPHYPRTPPTARSSPTWPPRPPQGRPAGPQPDPTRTPPAVQVTTSILHAIWTERLRCSSCKHGVTKCDARHVACGPDCEHPDDVVMLCHVPHVHHVDAVRINMDAKDATCRTWIEPTSTTQEPETESPDLRNLTHPIGRALRARAGIAGRGLPCLPNGHAEGPIQPRLASIPGREATCTLRAGAWSIFLCWHAPRTAAFSAVPCTPP